MADNKLGEKRVCASCNNKFYDLNKTPPTCPKCGTVFDVNAAQPKRRVSAKAVAKPAAKKPLKKAPEIVAEDDIDLSSFEDVVVDDAENLEEIEDIDENIESLSELEDREVQDDRVNSDDVDDEILIEEMGEDSTLVDDLEEEDEDEDKE